MLDALTHVRRELVVNAAFALAGHPTLPIFARDYLYPCRARVRVSCLLLFHCGNDLYRVHYHMICMITEPLCALATCLLCTCRSSPGPSLYCLFGQGYHHVR